MRLLIAMLKAAAVFAAFISLICFFVFLFETLGPKIAVEVLLFICLFMCLTLFFYTEN